MSVHLFPSASLLLALYHSVSLIFPLSLSDLFSSLFFLLFVTYFFPDAPVLHFSSHFADTRE